MSYFLTFMLATLIHFSSRAGDIESDLLAFEKTMCVIVTEKAVETGFLIDDKTILTTCSEFVRFKNSFEFDYKGKKLNFSKKVIVLFGAELGDCIHQLQNDLEVASAQVLCKEVNTKYKGVIRAYTVKSVCISKHFNRKTWDYNIAKLTLDSTSDDLMPIDIISENEVNKELSKSEGLHSLVSCVHDHSFYNRPLVIAPLLYVPYFKRALIKGNWYDPSLKSYCHPEYVDRELSSKQHDSIKHTVPSNPELFRRFFDLDKRRSALGGLVFKNNRAYGIITNEEINRETTYIYATRDTYTITPLWLPKVQKGLRLASRFLLKK